MPQTTAYHLRLKVFDHRYHARGQIGDPCTYCGAPSDTMDHVPPLRVAEMMVEAEMDARVDFVTVPACRECNSTLAGRALLRIKERRAHVKVYLRRKYAKVLRMPLWDEDELAELSEFMAHRVRAASNLSASVKARLAWRR